MTVHKWFRARAADRRARHAGPAQTLDLDLLDVMLDLDPGMLVWPGRDRTGDVLSTH